MKSQANIFLTIIWTSYKFQYVLHSVMCMLRFCRCLSPKYTCVFHHVYGSGCGLSFRLCIGAASLGLVVAYPLMKRVTDFPQGVLGLTFNWGALLGYSCVTGGVWDLSIMLPLYVAGWSWTMVLWDYRKSKWSKTFSRDSRATCKCCLSFSRDFLAFFKYIRIGVQSA